MKKTMKFLFTTLLLGGAAYAAFLFFAPEETRYVYRTQPVTRGSITSSVSATGKVSAVEMVEVGTQVSGTIKELYVDYNSEVEKGQLIALIDPDVLQSRVDEARASLVLSQAGVTRSRASVTDAERVHGRSKELWERNLIARSELDAAETTLLLARATLAESNARVVQAQAALRQAEANLSYTKIISPVDGIVISRQVDVGQTVAASLQTPTLFSIARDLTQMQIEASIDEVDIGRIVEGQTAVCRFDAWPDMTFEGVVIQVRLHPEVVSNVVTYTVVLQVDNSEMRLKPGMTANVSIVTEHSENVLRIAAAALRFVPPPEEVAAVTGDSANSGQNRQPGLFPFMARGRGTGPGGGARSGAPSANSQIVWLVEDGRLVGNINVETGVSDRTWIELRGDALEYISEGQELAVAFTREASGSATAGVR